MKKTIYVIPGFRHQPKQKAYKEMAKMLKVEGYQPIMVPVSWRQSTISENTEHFLKVYKKIKTRKKYILGFSFGAMIALLASTKVSTAGLILCSLSPYFQEDMKRVKKSSVSQLMKDDFSSLHCGTLVKQIKAKQIHMLYGAKETKSLINRVTNTFDQMVSEDKYLTSIKSTEHDIGNKKYLQQIHQVAKLLN